MRYFPAVLASLLIGVFATAEPAAAQGCVDCSHCQVGGDLGNKAPWGDETSISDEGLGEHGGCITTGTPDASCGTQHPYTCSPMQEEEQDLLATLNEVIEAVDADNAMRARWIVHAAASPSIVYVPERNAVQAIGCHGHVLAHIPLSPNSERMAVR